MASRGAVLRGALSIPGGARPTPAPQGSSGGFTPGNFTGAQGPSIGQISPLAAQLANEGQGYTNTYGGFLQRPTGTFTQGAFSPFTPILPVSVDEPPPDSGLVRPEARRFEYQVGWNLPIGQPGTEGLRLCSFETMRRLADVYSVVRACVEYWKNQVRGIQWDITPTPEAQKAYQGQPAKMADFGKRRTKVLKFFHRPDRDYFTHGTWVSALLEEVFVYDALSLLMIPPRMRGKGVTGSNLESLMLVHGPTIRPLLDLHGGTPRPPAPAYQQYLYGVPRSDYLTMITGQDLDEAGLTPDQALQFRGDQLLYVPMIPRAWTPYGFSCIERALIPIMTGLQKQGYQYDFFGESTVPASYIIPGDTAMTPNQIRELQDALNAIAGDPAWKQKIIVLPPGSHVEPQRPVIPADQLDEIVVQQVCMAFFGLTPMQIGVMPARSSSMGAANQMGKMAQDNNENSGLTPILQYLQDIFNLLIQHVMSQHDMMFSYEGLQQEEDMDQLTGILVQQMNNGLRTIDECRQELNLQPYGLEESSEPLIVTPQGPTPLSTAVQNAEMASQQAQASVAHTQAGTEATQQNTAASQTRLQMQQESHTQSMSERQERARNEPHPTAAAGAEGQQQQHSPGRVAATASNNAAASGGGVSASKSFSLPEAIAKKRADAEFEALARHLAKGRPISTWEARFIPLTALSDIARSMAEGLSPGEAVVLAKTRAVAKIIKGAVEWLPKAPAAPAATAASGASPAPAGAYPISGGAEQPPSALEWPGWQLDLQLSTLYVPIIQDAVSEAIRMAVYAWISKYVTGLIRVTPTWLAMKTMELIGQALAGVLDSLWTEAWALGDICARTVTEFGLGVTPDWRGWQPGNVAAARAIVGDNAELRRLTDAAGKNAADRMSETGLKNTLATVLRDGMNSGATAGDLTRQVHDAVNIERRAPIIASTETARASNKATLQVYRELGEDQKQWLVAPDEKVCPRCRACEAEGPIPESQPYVTGNDGPPAHPNCFVAGTLTEGPRVLAATERLYDGDLITVILDDGRELTGTPHHPILTRDGWTAMGDLHEGGNVLSARNLDTTLNPHDRQAVASIENTARLLRESGSVFTAKMPGSSVDFHGDGIPSHDVDVVTAAQAPVIDSVPELLEKRPHDLLVGTHRLTTLTSSDPGAVLERDSTPAAGGVGAVKHGSPVNSRSGLPSEVHGCRDVTDLNVVVCQHMVDGASADSEIFSKALRRLSRYVSRADLSPVGFQATPRCAHRPQAHSPENQDLTQRFPATRSEIDAFCESFSSDVSVDRIVVIRRVTGWSGHVYNLETSGGWYLANGIIAHNCRCASIPASIGGYDISDITSTPVPGFNVVPNPQHTPAAGASKPELVKVGPKGSSAEKQHNGEKATRCGQGHTHWGKHGAAGILIRAPRPNGEMAYLIQQRADTAYDNGGTWSTFGGALLPDETRQQGAERELEEETGIKPGQYHIDGVFHDDHGGWGYTTFTATAPEMFWPSFDGETPEENANWGWLTQAEMQSVKLHPGMKKTLPQVFAAEGSTEKSYRAVTLDGQEVWYDIPQDTGMNPAAGGGAMQMPPPPSGGVPGSTAGGEPPRWDGAEHQPHGEYIPAGDDGRYPTEGRVTAPPPPKGFPAQYMDGYWPGQQQVPQPGISSPGGQTGVPPSTVRAKPEKVEKVGKEGYIHGYICVRPPCGPQYTEATVDKRKGQVLHGGKKIGKVPSKDKDGKYSAIVYHTDAAGVEHREKLPARFDTPQQAFAAIPVYHSMITQANREDNEAK